MDFFTKYRRHLARRFVAQFSIYDADSATAAGFRAQQIRAILRLTPVTMLANALNAVIVIVAFADTDVSWQLLVWSTLLGYSIVKGTIGWLKRRNTPPLTQVSFRTLNRATQHATILGGIWGLLPMLLLGHCDAHHTMLLTTICTGMLCAGGFALSTIPVAAICYVATMSIGCEIALLTNNFSVHWDLAILLFIYSLIVCAAVLSSAKTFGARLVAEAEAAHQQQLVSLLLHDFESNTSDWLWEIDGAGYLVHHSKKILNVFKRTREQLRKIKFVDLFNKDNPIDDDEANALSQLIELLNEDKPFRELVLPIVLNNERRWLQLTAKPLLDNHGKKLGWRGVGSDVTHKRDAELEMRKLANYDSLTHLANRHQFNKQLEEIRQRRENDSFALFFFDLDNFKNVNDSLGHGIGDRVLQTVANRLASKIRSKDLLARLGGDEFALLSYGDASPARATQLAQRLLDSFAEPCVVDGKSLQLSCSIGIALLPDHCSDPESLLRNADMALYAAKSAGKNIFRFYEPSMGLIAQQKLNLINDMRRALENNPITHKLLHKVVVDDHAWPSSPVICEFELFFQPQIHLASNKILGFEALLRWHHPQLGLVLPSRFISLAEESNLIAPLGIWVLIEACKFAATWPQPWRVAVNLSVAQFRRSDIIQLVRSALHISGLAPERLELEITESLLIQDNQSAQQTLTALRELGIRIALDDFGTGYSSLAYLRNFPLNKLKIDRSFVSALTQDANARAIVTAIIQLADALNLEVTAEGIESADEVAILRECQCTHAQGNFFGAPSPEPQAIALERQYPHPSTR